MDNQFISFQLLSQLASNFLARKGVNDYSALEKKVNELFQKIWLDGYDSYENNN